MDEQGRMDLDDFLDHSGSTSGGAGFLGNWKEDGRIDIWLHPNGSFAALWSHRWIRLVKDKESEALIVRGWRWKCMEKESILKKQRFRNEDDSREYPPEICPLCLLSEWIREQVNEGKISWTDVLFRFEPEDDDSEVVEFHAGGLTGQIQKAFKDKSLTKDQRKELRSAGIRGDEIYREAMAARLQYVFTVVKHDDPDDGCVIAVETQTLGDKMKKAIRDRREDLGDKGNPLEHPYAFRWLFDDNKEFAAKYDVKPMTSLELNDDIQAVFDDDAADISELLKAGNVVEMRTSLESAWCGPSKCKPPWDDLFGAAEEAVKGTPAGEAPTDFEYGSNVDDGPDEDEADDEDEGYKCDVCGEVGDDPNKCEKCGAEYDEEGNLTKDPRKQEKKKPAGRSRRSAASKSSQTSKPTSRRRNPG